MTRNEDIKNILLNKIKGKGKEPVKQREAILEYIDVLEKNIVIMNKLCETIDRLDKNNKAIQLAEDSRKELENKNSELLLNNFKDTIFQLKDRSELNNISILLNEIKNKEDIPTDMTKVEYTLQEILNKDLDISEIQSALLDIYKVLSSSWLPTENAVQVIVKNQVQPISSGGGIIPFKNINNLPAKPLVNSDGSLVTNASSGFVSEKYDYISINYFDTVTEIYTYKLGGSSGITVAALTIVYTDYTKNSISTITKV